MQIHILTIFPKMFDAVLKESIIKRAQKKQLIDIQVHDLRSWADDHHKTVDDKPYGGGAGMILKIEPIDKAVKEIKSKNSDTDLYTILLAASGKQFTQKSANLLSKKQGLIFIAPRYEGVDHRVAEHIADTSISIGPYVLTGGEVPTMTVIDATVRLIPGVLGNEASLEEESFSEKLNGDAEYPQYTRPEEYNGWAVPKILLSGDHGQIEKWKKTPK